MFKTAISDIELSNTIALGAIFSTFGAAIISIFMVIESDKYKRIMTNIDILYIDILKIDKWKRWQFLDRKSSGKNLNNTVMTSVLSNPYVTFNVGSHSIGVHIPTVVEDFYDLPAYKNLWQIYKYRKHFYTLVTTSSKSGKCLEETSFTNWADAFMAWRCLYDIWKSVVAFKISRVFLKLGVYIIFISILYAFMFKFISKF